MNDHGCLGRWTCFRVLLTVGIIPVLLGGCGGGSGESEKGLIPVQGQVTLDGGPWPKPGQLVIVPVKVPEGGKVGAQSATASFETDGKFTVIGGFGDAKGLHPGEYLVAVECAEGDEEMLLPGEKPGSKKNYVPEKYRDPKTSGLKIEVSDKPVEANLDIKSKPL